MATLEDVARRAKVSTMTVSRVINDTGTVSARTRESVLAAVEELGYRTNMLARGLATGRSNIIAYIVPDVSDPYFNLVFKGAEAVSRENGMTAVFLSAENQDALHFALKMSIDHKFDGIIMHDLDPDDEALDLLTSRGIPCVLVDCERTIDTVSTLELDHFGAAVQVAELLAGQGCETIYCVHGPLDEPTGPLRSAPRRQCQRRIWRERSEGFRAGLARYGLAPRMLLADRFEFINSYLSSQDAAEIIYHEQKWPAGVYCEDDILALGVSGYMQERGIRLPEQLAIVGNDGLEMSTTLYPRITTILHPREQIGRQANEILLRQLRGGAPVVHELAAFELFWGDTTQKKPE